MDVEQSAWLAMCAGDDREHGGNDGYADLPESHYLWDSTVGNASKIKVGDKIVLWDKEILLGVSVIEHIEVDQETKTTYKCPTCKKAHINSRKTLLPRYKCYNALCKERRKQYFDDPIVVRQEVVTYQSHHSPGWIDLRGLLRGKQLRDLCVQTDSQGSLRELSWEAFLRELGDEFGEEHRGLMERTTSRIAAPIAGGHQKRTVRVRIGQAQFRQRLLDQVNKPVCAFTGPSPVAVLEAGHLYSYAAEGRHYEHGGLLMRRDVHALFDRGHLAVDPSTGKIDVSPQIRDYEAYRPLHGQPLHVPLLPRQMKWLAQHWDQYRGETAKTV